MTEPIKETDQVVRHLSKDDPKTSAQMPGVERAAYDRGWLDASAAMFAHLGATKPTVAGPAYDRPAAR